MNRLFVFAAVALVTIVCTSMAFDYADPTGTSGNTVYSQTDVFGDIISTIPLAAPGTNNAWVGQAYANGELLQFKNVYPNTVPSQFLRINPSTGAIIATVNLPFNGYVMDATYDGTNLWVAQWSPVNMIHKVSLTGQELFSFTPVTAGYSARCPNWDGTNLWVGCDLGSANTKLIKMTTTGTNVQEWMTGSAVGWYMGGEFSTDAPAGANLYVVDNVGNTIKRLNLGTSITVAAQVNSPAVSPDVAEGLTFDGQYLWHCGAYASAGVAWKIDDGFIIGPPPNLDVVLTPINPPIVVPAQGGNFDFTAAVTNLGPNQTPFWAWARIKNPDGSYTAPTLGPININPPVGTQVSRTRTQSVPGTWPSGTYSYVGYAALAVGYPALDSSSFTWTKSATADGGPAVWEAVCSGEPFPGEVMAQPATHSVLSNYPNPFNPSTTISFTLGNAGNVQLTVYDVNGREVTRLVNGYRAAGQHSVSFDGSNLASGVYLYTLSANGQTSTAKMMLVK